MLPSTNHRELIERDSAEKSKEDAIQPTLDDGGGQH